MVNDEWRKIRGGTAPEKYTLTYGTYARPEGMNHGMPFGYTLTYGITARRPAEHASQDALWV